MPINTLQPGRLKEDICNGEMRALVTSVVLAQGYACPDMSRSVWVRLHILPAVQHMGLRQGCPLSPTLFGIFFDGLHDYLLAWAPAVGVHLRSGRWVSSLVYADDAVLLSWTSHGLQHLIDGMHQFCHSMGLTISPTKTEVVVFHPQPSNSQPTWHVHGNILPVSPSFNYLGLIFHQSGDMVPAIERLLQNAE